MAGSTPCRAADAGIVGALLLSPRGPIAHAGFYFSRLTGTVEHRFAGAPADLPAALEVAACPVSGAFQYIRPEVLAAIGVYDPEFRMGSEDLDFCLRAADAGFASVCQGRARAVHVEAVFRGRPSPKLDAWHAQSYARFQAKWSPAQLGERIADVPTPGDSARACRRPVARAVRRQAAAGKPLSPHRAAGDRARQ